MWKQDPDKQELIQRGKLLVEHLIKAGYQVDGWSTRGSAACGSRYDISIDVRNYEDMPHVPINPKYDIQENPRRVPTTDPDSKIKRLLFSNYLLNNIKL